MCLRGRHGQSQDFHPLGPPLAGRVLMGRYPDFLACLQAICVARMALAGRYFFSIHDLSVGDFHPAQHAISALNKNPALYHRLTRRWIGYLAAEGPIGRRCARCVRQQPKSETQHPAQLHTNCDAELPSGVPFLVVILKPQMGNKRLAPQVAQRVFQLHQLNEEIVLRIKSRRRHGRL